MGEWLDPARIDPEIYRYWVNENPKQVLGGQLRLVKNHDPLHFQDDVKLPAHDVSSNVLSSPHSDNLRIYGFPNKFKGFKIIVRNDQGYLLRLPVKECPPELIQAKRMQLTLIRECR